MVENRFTRQGVSHSAMWCIGQAMHHIADGPIFSTPSGPGDFGPWRRWLALVVGWHHGLQLA